MTFWKHLLKHTPERKAVLRYLALLALLVGYFAYLSFKFDILTGGIVSLLTWSFFVLCTPIADAGFLVDFPLRLLFDVRMVFSEMFVWVVAITMNTVAMIFFRDAYPSTFLTALLEKIITTPYPYWSIILLSGLGTFLSVFFGDEMVDAFRHRTGILKRSRAFKLKLLAMLLVFGLIFVGYGELLQSLDIHIKEI